MGPVGMEIEFMAPEIGYDLITLALVVAYIALRIAERLVTAFLRKRRGKPRGDCLKERIDATWRRWRR